MTNNGLKISEMTYSTIEDAVNNNAQVPVSAEIDGVKVNRRIPIKLITDGLITDNYVEKNPDNQDTQIINSPIKITSLNDTASLIVKGIIEISDTGTQDKNTYNIITMTDTLASSYTCIPNGKAHFYSYLNSGGYVMNNAGLNSDDGDGYYGHSITHQDSNAAIITKSRIEATKANVYAQNIIEANISNNIGYCNNLSAVYDGTNRVEVHESISPSMYNKVLSYHNSDLISIYINGLDNKLIKIDNINVELKSACIIDSDSRCGTEGQVLSSTGTGVAWVNQSSGGGGITEDKVNPIIVEYSNQDEIAFRYTDSGSAYSVWVGDNYFPMDERNIDNFDCFDNTNGIFSPNKEGYFLFSFSGLLKITSGYTFAKKTSISIRVRQGYNNNNFHYGGVGGEEKFFEMYEAGQTIPVTFNTIVDMRKFFGSYLPQAVLIITWNADGVDYSNHMSISFSQLHIHEIR